ncbi:MAG: addiction module protein [Bryobacteraceae bacterium]
MSNLPQHISDLSAAQKFELLDALWESLESDLPALTSETREELDRREARYRQYPCAATPWEDIKADFLKKR